MRGRITFTTFGLVAAIALIVLFSQFGLAVYEYARHAAAVLPFPFPVEYGEGAVLDQVMRLARGENIYRLGLNAPPFTVTGDPPLFRLLQVPFAWAFGPAFWYGRAISVIGAALAALFLGLTLYALTDDRAAAAAAGLTLLAFPHILQWSALDRADAPALALSWAGLYALVRRPDRSRGPAAAGLLFAAAAATRLPYGLVGPATAFAWLIQNRCYRSAIALAAWFGGACLALLLALNGVTRGDFLASLQLAAGLEFSRTGLITQLTGLLLNAWLLTLAALGFMVVERWWYPTRSWPFVTPYILSAGLTTLLLDRSSGGPNAVYGLAAALCLAGGAVIAWPGRRSWLRLVAILLLALQVNWLVTWWRNDYAEITLHKVRLAAEIGHLAQIVRAAPGPVLADEYMGLLPAAGRPLYLQPVEFAQLQRTGRWDAGGLIAAIQRREFAAILLYEPPFGQPMIVARWPAAVRNAIWANYEPRWWSSSQATLAYVWVYVPRP